MTPENRKPIFDRGDNPVRGIQAKTLGLVAARESDVVGVLR